VAGALIIREAALRTLLAVVDKVVVIVLPVVVRIIHHNSLPCSIGTLREPATRLRESTTGEARYCGTTGARNSRGFASISRRRVTPGASLALRLPMFLAADKRADELPPGGIG
jgi:hypothetical protein